MGVATVRVLGFQRLMELNAHAQRCRAAHLSAKQKAKLGPDEVFAIGVVHAVNEFEVRAELVLDDQGTLALLDIPVDAFNRLPILEARTSEPAAADDGKAKVNVDSLFE